MLLSASPCYFTTPPAILNNIIISSQKTHNVILPNRVGTRFHLKSRQTVFSKVTDGLDVVDAIEKGDTMQSVTVSKA